VIYEPDMKLFAQFTDNNNDVCTCYEFKAQHTHRCSYLCCCRRYLPFIYSKHHLYNGM